MPTATRSIWVVGPSRSGTSAVAGALHSLGVYMGEKLMPPSLANPRGYFEDMQFVNINKRFAPGGLPLTATEPDSPSKAAYVGLMNIRARKHRVWGVKDPRLCRVGQWVIPLARDARVVQVHRPLYSVADSLVDRDGLTREVAMSIALTEYQGVEALEKQLGVPWHCVEYNELLDDTAATIRKLARFVFAYVNPKPVIDYDAAVAFVEPGLRHHG